MEFISQSTSSKLVGEVECNKPLSYSNQALPEIASIYGGVGTVAIQAPQSLSSSTNAYSRSAYTEINPWSPSLQNLLDQPPATLPQRLITGGMVFCFAFGTWAWFGQIEEVGKAQGKLVPKGETYKIEPLNLGKVSKVLVKEGEVVKAGQILVELDTELAQKEVDRLEQILSAYRLELSHKHNLLDRVSLETKTLAAIAASDTLAQRSLLAAAREKVVTTRILLAQMRSEAAAYRARQVEFKQLTSMAQNKAEQLRSEVKA
ncbi:MAG: biotin/lipoyl-binding protein, partial [Prochloraceae cyanobacterium]